MCGPVFTASTGRVPSTKRLAGGSIQPWKVDRRVRLVTDSKSRLISGLIHIFLVKESAEIDMTYRKLASQRGSLGVFPMIRIARLALWGSFFVAVVSAFAQDQTPVGRAVQAPVQTPEVTYFQLQRYLMKRISTPHSPGTPGEWNVAGQKLRKHVLEDIVYHGWPQSWVEAAPHFEQVEVMETGKGYRLRKFRYEIVPGFTSTAILYEPEGIQGRVPAILNVIGHEPEGNAVEYEQKRCINFAKRGILARSLSWIGFGEMAQPENGHDNAARLDLVGSSAVGFFYLSMRRGLDFLATLPQADPARLGVTGLSGGGWQTVFLMCLDPR